jgi:GNAT superfamily N-acetyltransferase
MQPTVQERPADDPELTALLDAAFAELVARYGSEGRSHVKPGARYLVVVDPTGAAVACGAVQPFDADSDHPGDAELKRMYVHPSVRGRGYARALLAALEQLARTAGHPNLRLSTGNRQPEAITLYTSSGYTPTPPWGKYRRQPGTLCLTKPL